MRRKNRTKEKRGLKRKRGNFFRSKLVLNSMKSKVAFFVIVLMFGVVISIGVLDVADNLSGVKEKIGLSPQTKQNYSCDNQSICEEFEALVSNEFSLGSFSEKSEIESLEKELQSLRSLKEGPGIDFLNNPLLRNSDSTKEEITKLKIPGQVGIQTTRRTFPSPNELRSDKVLLRSRKFELKEVDSKVSNYVIGKGEKIHTIMQFDKIPDFNDRNNLKKIGIEFLSYIPNNAWVVSFNAHDLQKISSLVESVAIILNVVPDATTEKTDVGEVSITGKVTFGNELNSLNKINEKYQIKEIVQTSRNEYFVILPKNVDIQSALNDYKSDLFVSEAEIAVKSSLNGIETLTPNDKLLEDVKNRNFNSATLNNDGTVNLIVLFHKDVKNHIAKSVISSVSGEILDNSVLNNWYFIRIPINNIENLAANDEVKLIEQIFPKEILNDGARENLKVNILQEGPYSLSGKDIVVGEWDCGHATHLDYDDRTSYLDGFEPCYHAIHVAGTILGSGLLSEQFGGAPLQWRGMAPRANLASYDWNDPLSEYELAIKLQNIDLSTNSWGGGETDSMLDAYDSLVRGSASKQIPIFWAAGNSGNYYTITGQGSSKNDITVGASNSDSNTIAFFSSRGPSQFDGRLKPEITAPGCEGAVEMGSDIGGVNNSIWSTWPGNTYDGICGTSMATPAAAGSYALLLEHYRSLYLTGIDPLPSTGKGLLVHTALDLGNTGPDYTFGYGNIDVKKAVDYITQGYFSEHQIENGETDSYFINVQGNHLKVTLVWDDFPADVFNEILLVNDLDLVLIDPQGNTHYPWILNNNAPEELATKGEDHLNIIEQVEVENPVLGQWEIKVNGTLLPEIYQDYSLITDYSILPANDVEAIIPFISQETLYNFKNLIPVILRNRGDETISNLVVKLYDATTDTLINSTNVNLLNAGGEIIINLPWAPNETGKHLLKALINFSDSNLNNNDYLREASVITDAPDIYVSPVFENGPIIAGLSNNINFTLFNIGPRISSSGTAQLYDLLYDELISNISIGEIGPRSSKEISFDWTPDLTGLYILKLDVYDKDDYSSENNEGIYAVDSFPNSPDIYVIGPEVLSLTRVNYSSNNLTLLIANFGGKPANNVSIKFYIDYMPSNLDSAALFDEDTGLWIPQIVVENSFIIGNLPIVSSSLLKIDFSIGEVGWHNLTVKAELEGDYSIENNYTNDLKIHPNSSDLKAWFSYEVSPTMVVNESETIYGFIENLGPLIAKNVTTDLYTSLNGNNWSLIGNWNLGGIECCGRNNVILIGYNTSQLGTRYFKINSSTDNDWDLTNNELIISKEVVPWKDVTFIMNDVPGFFSGIIFSYGFLLLGGSLVDGNITLSLPDYPTGILPIFIRGFDLERFNILFLGSNLSDTMEIEGNAIYENKSLGNLKLHAVYVVKPNWKEYTATLVGVDEDLDRIGLGFNSFFDLGLFSCSLWDSQNNLCLTEWEDIEVTKRKILGLSPPMIRLLSYTEGNKIEAFAIGVKRSQICGNSIIEAGEECDDGNTNNNDACRNDCKLNVCGDGFVNSEVEQCDDGNIINGDGCSSTCQVEAQCSSGADSNGNGNINQDELNNYIQQYYLGNVNINNVSNAIIEHLNGCV